MPDLTSAHRLFAKEIEALSRSQFVPGLEADDVAAEMTVALFKACETHDPDKGPLGAWWWSIWQNRRNNITESHNAMKRIRAIPVDPHDLSAFCDRPVMPAAVPPCPSPDPVVGKVWDLLGHGLNGLEVRSYLAISWRAFYKVIERLRTEEVRDYLRPD